MNLLQKFLLTRFLAVGIILSIGGGVLYYIDSHLNQSALEKRLSKRNAAHERVISQFKSSIDNFATLVSGIRSYIQLSPEMPGPKELQKFINTQLIDIKYNKELVVSFIDTTHVFQYVFTRDKIDPANLIGKSVGDLLEQKELDILSELLENDGLYMYNPLNIQEGWLGIPLDFRVVKQGEVIGYIAPILNLGILLDEVYDEINTKEFSLRFSTGDNIDFDRQAFYDGSDIFNESIDNEFYNNFNISPTEYTFSNIELYGKKFRIGIAFKVPLMSDPFILNLFLGWYIMLVIFLAALLWQSFNYKQLNAQYHESNDLLIEQKKRISEQSEQAHRDLSFIQNVAKLSPVHIYIFDLHEKKNIYENKNIAEYLGYEKGIQLLHDSILNDHLHPDDRLTINNRPKNYAQLNDDAHLDTIVRLLDNSGQWKWFLGKEVIFKRSKDGSPKQILGIAEDITEIKKIEIKLIESEKKLNNAQEISNIGHWEIDLKSKKAIGSDEFFKIFGIKSIAIKKKIQDDGNYFQKYIHHNDIIIVNEKYQAGLKTGEKYGLDYRIIDQNKDLKYIHSIVHFILNENGNPIKTWGTIQDITERKIAEQLLEGQMSELERVNTELDRFVYRVTHDLKSPLGNMIGLISLAQGEQNTKQILEYLPMMETSVQKMEHFINDLVSYARNANSEIQKENIDLKLLFSEIVDEHKFTQNADKIKFKTLVKGKNEIFSDHSRMRIVFNNLISNAIKYHDFSKKQPSIEVLSVSNKKITTIEVIDNGSGMESSELEKIFDMFYRAQSNTSKVSGSGIGLYILRETLKKLGGDISVDSMIGQGTTFRITLPNE